MNTTNKLILVLIFIGLATGAVFLFMNSGDSGSTGPKIPTTVTDPDRVPDSTAGGNLTSTTNTPEQPGNKDPKFVREVLPTLVGDGGNLKQGVAGRLIDADGFPIADAQIYLMPGLGKDALERMQRRKDGINSPPAAAGKSNEEGLFRMGIKEYREGDGYEVRIVHDQYCEKTLPNIHVQPEDFYDAGEITLVKGVTIRGSVTIAATGLPTPGATVTLMNPQQSGQISPTPGRENGYVVETDASGNYSIPNVNKDGIFNLEATAPNFATEFKKNLRVRDQKSLEINFALSRGYLIAGTVADPQGKPIAKAKVTAAALDGKSNQIEITYSDSEGNFSIPGLRESPFLMIAEATGYTKTQEKPVPAGKADLILSMERQGTVIVQVLDKAGRPQTNYNAHVKTQFPGQEYYGNTAVRKKVRGATDGVSELQGLDPMNYVVQITAHKHAKCYSEPFTITAGQQEPAKVEVNLHEGGILQGKVTDESGSPLAGIDLQTLPNRHIETPFHKIFQVPYIITKRKTKTDSEGNFRIPLLNEGKYRLELTSIDFCTVALDDLDVRTGDTNTVPTVTMIQGTLVTGTTMVKGKLSGQVKVTVSVVNDPLNPQPFSSEAISDNDGRFVLNKRLKPGDYTVHAAQMVQANPMMILVQYKKSKQNFTLHPGQNSHELKMHIQD